MQVKKKYNITLRQKGSLSNKTIELSKHMTATVDDFKSI